MSRTVDLGGLARQFADRVQSLLNGTVSNGALVRAVVIRDRRHAVIGTKLDTKTLIADAIPLTLGRKAAKVWLALTYRCDVDPDHYLMVTSSYCGIYADGEQEACLCHFDYERDKPQYPEAHLQVHGTSSALAELSDRKETELDKLHFPVGGRRYRPSLEDIIEFLIVEELVQGRPGWEDRLGIERQRFHDIQLSAAVRRRPDVAIATLGEMDLIPEDKP